MQDLADLETQRRLRDEREVASRIQHRWHTFDSVAVWGFSSFGYEDRRLDEHMERARDYAWLILDLRDNPGGAVEGITRLLGHLFDEPFDAFTQRWRDSTTQHRVEPRGQGGVFGGRVVVLVNSGSASAAEIVSRVLQLRDRGTVIGDRTAGAVMGSEIVPLAIGDYGTRVVFFGLSVTVFDVVMNDGTRLEGVGVEPDEVVLPVPADFAERRDPALQRALELAGVRMSAEEAGGAWR